MLDSQAGGPPRVPSAQVSRTGGRSLASQSEMDRSWAEHLGFNRFTAESSDSHQPGSAPGFPEIQATNFSSIPVPAQRVSAFDVFSFWQDRGWFFDFLLKHVRLGLWASV